MSRLSDFSEVIGNTISNRDGIEFRIIAISKNKASGGRTKVIVKSLKSGYESEVEYSNFLKGIIKDYGVPTVYGVGFAYKRCKSTSNVYKRWNRMLERCYSKRHKSYYRYGGKGVKVCERWLHLKNFEEDVKKLKNYDKFIENPRLYSLDKDILGDGMLYSPETCMFANPKEQTHAQERVKKIIAIDKNGKETLFDSVHECSTTLGVPNANVYGVLRGERKQAQGYSFRRP